MLPCDPCGRTGALQALLLGCPVSPREDQRACGLVTWRRARGRGALRPAEESGCPATRDTGPGHAFPICHSLLFSFMNVHMSLSSGLCAKEQFPTYWHLRPFCAWMQSCGR